MRERLIYTVEECVHVFVESVYIIHGILVLAPIAYTRGGGGGIPRGFWGGFYLL